MSHPTKQRCWRDKPPGHRVQNGMHHLLGFMLRTPDRHMYSVKICNTSLFYLLYVSVRVHSIQPSDIDEPVSKTITGNDGSPRVCLASPRAMFVCYTPDPN
jgi:hypothetical protein